MVSNSQFRFALRGLAGFAAFALAFLIVPRCWATVYLDTYLSLANQTVGATATAAVLNSGTIGAGSGSWTVVGTASSLTVAAHGIDDSHSTMVGFANQPTTQGQMCLALNNSSSYTYAEFSAIPAGHRQIQVSGWFKPGMVQSGFNYYDCITIRCINGKSAYMQMQTPPGSYDVNIETVPASTTLHTADIALTKDTWYWYIFRADFIGGTTSLWMYDTNGGLVGTVSGNCGVSGSDLKWIRVGNAENGTGGGTTYWQDLGWDFTYVDYVPRANRGVPNPAERQADWNNAGFTVPNVNTIFTTVPAGSSAATVMSAIQSCPSNQVVMLAAGNYSWSSPVDFSPSDNGVVLRGTKSNGTNASTVTWSGTRAVRMITFDETKMANDVNITSNIRKGDTTIKVAAVPTWCKVGYTLGLDQLNDEVVSSVNTCREGANIYRAKTVAGGNGDRGQGELVLIAATTSTTITTVHPILHDFSVGRTAQIFMPGYDMASTGPVRKCGIEDINFEGSDASSGARCISIINGVNCWVTGVNSHKSRSLHIFSEAAYQCVYRNNYLYDAWTFSNTGEGYGITFYEWSTRNLIENNIVRRCGSNLQFNYGSSGNVAAYNYCLEAHSDTKDGPEISIHGNSADYNLFEGNYGDGKARFDCVHGSSFANVLFRNRMAGKVDTEIALGNSENQIACDVDYWNHNATILGNVFGTTGFHTVRLRQAPTGGSSTDKNVYSFGYQNAFGFDAGCSDSAAQLNYTLHNNWDAVTAGIAYDATIADRSLANSLYLTSKPAWFGDRAWPPFSPSSPAMAVATNIPAGYRYVFGVNPTSGPVNQAPVASATAAPMSGVAPLAVTFSSAGSSDPEGATLSYSWVFGDGGTAVTPNPAHTYLAAGNYAARLTVSDGTNTVSSTSLNIVVTVPGQNLTPTALAATPTPSGYAPLSVSFSSAGSSDPEGTALTYNWSFGDGATAVTANPTHLYSTPGVFLAQLRVSDGTNTSSPASVTITVGDAADSLVAAYGFEEGAGTGVTDVSGSGNAGIIVGATRMPGRFGSGLFFNGTGAMVTINDAASLDLTTAMTLEAWVFPTALGGYRDVIFKDTDIYRLMGSTSQGFPAVGGNFAAANAAGTSALPLNAWTHLAGTYDGTTMRFYTNGVLVASRAQTGAISTSTGPLSIGGDATFGQYWAGMIDEVRIYNRALSASEVLTDMNTAVTATGSRPPAPGVAIIPKIVSATTAKRGAVPLTVAFASGADWGANYLLSFGDGTTNSNPNSTHIYGNAGTYDVSVYQVLAGVNSHVATYSGYVVVTNSP